MENTQEKLLKLRELSLEFLELLTPKIEQIDEQELGRRRVLIDITAIKLGKIGLDIHVESEDQKTIENRITFTDRSLLNLANS